MEEQIVQLVEEYESEHLEKKQSELNRFQDMASLELVIRGDRSPEELLKIAENSVQPMIEQVEGVSLTSVVGGRKAIVRVEISANRLEAYNLTLTQITQPELA